MIADLLDAVVAGARRSAIERERLVPRAELVRAATTRRPAGDRFHAALSSPGINVIAECKRRSPSKGVLRHGYDPVAIAAGYEQAGAAAISVLTEPTFFDGSLDHLRAVRARVRTPLLRKDFIVDEYQIAEAAAAGADAILLIVAALGDAALRSLLGTARELGLAALVEVHDARELSRAADAGADIVGVNSRNLRTLTVDPHVLDDLARIMPAGVVAVAESGLRSADDLVRLHRAGYSAFLIGERFMVEPEPGHALRQLVAAASRGAA